MRYDSGSGYSNCIHFTPHWKAVYRHLWTSETHAELILYFHEHDLGGVKLFA